MLRKIAPLWILLLLLPLTFHAQEYGSGWNITFYNSPNLTGFVAATRVADRLDFNFTSIAPAIPEGVSLREFSFAATTTLEFSEGTYVFRGGSNDGLRAYIDGNLLFDSFVEREYIENQDQRTIFLTGGAHTLRVEYFQSNGVARMRFNWDKISSSDTTLSGGAVDFSTTGGSAPMTEVARGSVRVVEGLSVRSGPFLGASRLDIIAPGQDYPVFARNDDEGEFTWYLIQVQDFIEVVDDTTGETISQPVGDPVVGWVSGRYFYPDVPNASVIPEGGSVFGTLGAPPRTGVNGVLRSNMRLRAGPSYRTPTVMILDWGAEVEIVSRTVQGGQNHWFQVYYEGQVGWLFADFLAINGDINDVPRY